ncbi:hypothetical protein [Motilimonas pumila]|uniref:hypothetical protein n=1 Tax=Motilimonas pumila TaxID=2303987 RepID=UPI0018E07AC6|nr:hypothetical protein [Motilimonas pumila]
MRDIQILQQTLAEQCPNIHKKRQISLILATKSVLNGADLTLTKLGRKLDSNTRVKHAIKRVDRLLGNPQLHREKDTIYKWHTHLITRANPCPMILVDWSDVREQLRYMTLRRPSHSMGVWSQLSNKSLNTVTHRVVSRNVDEVKWTCCGTSEVAF